MKPPLTLVEAECSDVRDDDDDDDLGFARALVNFLPISLALWGMILIGFLWWMQ